MALFRILHAVWSSWICCANGVFLCLMIFCIKVKGGFIKVKKNSSVVHLLNRNKNMSKKLAGPSLTPQVVHFRTVSTGYNNAPIFVVHFFVYILKDICVNCKSCPLWQNSWKKENYNAVHFEGLHGPLLIKRKDVTQFMKYALALFK